jgi:hypothetical protein
LSTDLSYSHEPQPPWLQKVFQFIMCLILFVRYVLISWKRRREEQRWFLSRLL